MTGKTGQTPPQAPGRARSLKIHTDGGSRGNPGPAAAAFAARDAAGGQTVGYAGLFLGRATNNVAEYSAVIAALEFARTVEAGEVEILSDSELMVRQMNGMYRVRNPRLLPLYVKARQLADTFQQCRFTHVRREYNVDADRLVNLAIDQKRDIRG